MTAQLSPQPKNRSYLWCIALAVALAACSDSAPDAERTPASSGELSTAETTEPDVASTRQGAQDGEGTVASPSSTDDVARERGSDVNDGEDASAGPEAEDTAVPGDIVEGETDAEVDAIDPVACDCQI